MPARPVAQKRGISRQPLGRAIPAVDRELVAMPVQLETQILAAWALRELLDNPGRDDWDDLVASYRALMEAIATGEPMTRKDARIVAEHLRGLGWTEFAIGAATKPGPDLESSGGQA
jgi:hypothetical protein